jgi:hypothetical protein
MTSIRQYIFSAITIVVLVTAGYFGYKYYRVYNNPSASCISAIPGNSALFIEMNNPVATVKKLTTVSDLWSELTGINEINKLNGQLEYFDSLTEHNEELCNVFCNHKMVISVHPGDSLSSGLLYIVKIPPGKQDYSAESLAELINGKQSYTKYKEVIISEISLSENKNTFSFTSYKGLLIGSFNKLLVKKSIERLNSEVSFENDNSYLKLRNTAGKKVDANIYFNLEYLDKLKPNLLSSKTQKTTGKLTDFGLWTETDLIIKKDEILLNGYTIASDSLSQYLSCFGQEPQSIKAPGILPYNISLFLDLSFQSFGKYLAGYKKYLKKTGRLSDYEAGLKSMNRKYGIKLQKQFFSWITDETGIALVSGNNNPPENTYAFFHTNDIKNAIKLLENISENVSKHSKNKKFSREYNEYLIRRIDIPGLLPKLFGPWFAGIKKNYYIAIKDYIVFANDPESLMHLINSFYIRKTLAENFNYREFSDNIAESSNIYLYCNVKKSTGVFVPLLSQNLKMIINDNLKTVTTLEGFAVQFSYINKMYYTNAYLKYNPDYREENPTNWETGVDANIKGKPYLIRNHKNGKLNIIVFDEHNNMYLIDHQGVIKWKKALRETPESDVFLVDYYQNRKYQYLFNSRNYLYLIDLLGNYVTGYPVRLETSATNGLSVFDYDNDGKYRLMLALEDNRIYDYNIKGEQVEGWNKIQMKKSVPYPVEHIRAGGKDYLLVTDKNGNVTITNRRGETRIRMKRKFVRAKNSVFYKNETNSRKGIFLTTDEAGKLTYISAKGKTKTTSFGTFSPNHFFLYEDFNGDNSKDFIYLDNRRLTVFDKFKKELLSYTFDNKITVKPVFFITGNKRYLAITDSGAQEVYIFDKSGRAFSNMHISGTSGIATGSLNNDGKANLIICSGKTVYNFQLFN